MAEGERRKEGTICSVGRRGKGAKKEKISGHAHSTCQRVVARAISTPSAAVDALSPTPILPRGSAAAPHRPLSLSPQFLFGVASWFYRGRRRRHRHRHRHRFFPPPGFLRQTLPPSPPPARSPTVPLPSLETTRHTLSISPHSAVPLLLPRGSPLPRAPLTRAATVPRPGRAGVNRSRTSIGRASQRSLLFLLSHNACLSERVPRASCRSGISRVLSALPSPAASVSVVSLSLSRPSSFLFSRQLLVLSSVIL